MVRTCEMCPEKKAAPATVYCAADVCYLCTACDEEVHSANRLAKRHVRRTLVCDDSADGSSINDDSDARVPDVSTISLGKGTGVSTHASTNVDQEAKSDLPTLNDVSVTFEDAAEYDFCFDTIGPRMTPLIAGDDDNLFSDGKLAKSFYGELSWDSVVPDSFEHVVPDVETSLRKDIDSKVMSAHGLDIINKRPPTTRFSKNEDIHLDMDSDVDLSPSSESFSRGDSTSLSDVNVDIDENINNSISVKGNKIGHNHVADAKSTTAVKDEPSDVHMDESTNMKKSNNQSANSNDNINDSPSVTEDEAKLSEQRKKRRQEALARFRSKRANRSFTKKVRYECRKQLADSRPRVKGRFVRKVEMALFRKYGAMYRDHLDELKENDDKRISSPL